ncbi:unnamed protein product [Caenorhabditis auriculariae]|uniref:G-protein coupled receptors family 1 profile domain-containing protein n=1 Tax=Caenorhabditis auriculariae TaxID=2777116 RepID=A0A8S1H3L6_9PELO|nr:unnamed protein product [Caenorhabditis auriculariae]
MECASPALVEVLTSVYQQTNAILFLLIAIATVIVSFFAAKALIECQIFPKTTRIIFAVGLAYANLHEIVKFYIRGKALLNSWTFDGDTCRLVMTALECRMPLNLIWMCMAGMVFTDTALTFDRLLATLFPTKYSANSILPGILFSLVVIALSVIITLVTFGEEDYHGYVTHCIYPPEKSGLNIRRLLKFYTVVNFVNIALNLLVLWLNRRASAGIQYDLQQRYHNYEVLTTTKAVSIIAIVQFIALGIYTSAMLFLTTLSAWIPQVLRLTMFPWLYAVTYGALLLPILIVVGASRVAKRRRCLIRNITAQKESQDDRMKQLNDMWR